MIRFSHKANSWQQYLGHGCWACVGLSTARALRDNGHSVAQAETN
jgi:uroporphyrinogen-III synthase